ncbi:MAG: bifunctional phosphopantothenoylcysteine decarboxylase/phosphopantothenate--cysteine ligase CoaBC [Candidatus Lokiarchaeota archaeon]|nr:bifunctional phosphopantothenoylcysteine decarboxylase/phosphopantothenate--cysteine ligase CoaBC [Candidatus Lokiarchaeota archaeon]MBD3198666.1 bifunctional phosphopantothenoylcysteine decarboxylase/phosphopantothenate--cysteine ligase CoaBC [Candidatus Lokiarchaeota archaeon]
MKSRHPSKDIVESEGTILRGKTICMCLTGSVAIISAPIIARELMRRGAEVIAVMTHSATELITPQMMHWATGNLAISKLTGAVEHVYLAGERPRAVGQADLILVCPATANTISKIATGIDDTPVTTVVTTAFGSSTPIIIVPAMHESMFRHPILKENMIKLRKYGVEILGPRISEGKAKIARIDDIIDRTIDLLVSKKDLHGMKVLVTAGPSREAIDEIRFVSNQSSGRMGIEIAKECSARGADVLLVNGKSTVEPPDYLNVVNVTSTDDFINTVMKELKKNNYDMFLCAAAISDYSPTSCIEGKISSDEVKELNVNMRLTPKIINEARSVSKKVFIVAFKAETNVSKSELIDRAYSRLKKSNANMIIANDVGREDIGFESTENEVYIIDKEKHITHVEKHSKRFVASRIMDVALENFRIKDL